jgi:hypothetical protein
MKFSHALCGKQKTTFWNTPVCCLLRRLSEMREDGVKVITLLALSDRGKPDYDVGLAKEISKLGIACFACTPDRLPELVEAAIKGLDLKRFE